MPLGVVLLGASTQQDPAVDRPEYFSSLLLRLKWKGSDLDPHFRLWLSSKPDPVFPASILQRAIKVSQAFITTASR